MTYVERRHEMFEPDRYVRAESIDQVVSILGENKETAKIISGGTLLHELAARGMLPNVKVLIDLQKLGLTYIREEDNTIRIGAMTTHTEIHEYFKNSPKYVALAEASKLIQQIRNAATIGGCVCCGIPWFELPVALLVYDSELVVHGPDGEKVININEFYVDYLFTALQPTEFITEIRIPKALDGTISRFVAHKMGTVGVPIMSVAVKVVKEEGDVCREARIAVGSAGRVTFRIEDAEKRLLGKGIESTPADAEMTTVLTKEAAERAKEKALRSTEFNDVVDAVLSRIRPMGDALASEKYRKHICKILVQKALEGLK
jgi:CO/xanthine dehydrogenase FAD-binding subunit